MNSEPTVESLHIQINRLEWVLVMFLLCGLGFFCLVALNSSLMVPKFTEIFQAMLGSRSLPTLTQFIINFSNTGLPPILAVAIPFTAAALLVIKRKTFTAWLIAIGVMFLLIVISAITTMAMFAPMIAIITELNNAP